MKYIDASNIVKIADVQLTEIDKLWTSWATRPVPGAQRDLPSDRLRFLGRIEGLAMALNVLSDGGDDDED